MRRFLSLLLLVFLFPFLTTTAHAKSYAITPVRINAELHKDGSMTVSETRTYNFSGDYTFAYLKINSRANQSKAPGRTEPYKLSDFSLCETGNCYKQLETSQIAAADNSRPPGSFYVQDNGSNYYVKWFYRSNSTKTFTLNYTVDNAITNHQDIAELYWQWIGDEWEISEGNVAVTLTLPDGVPDTEIQAWLHGALNGTVAIPDAKHVTFTAPYVPAGKYFEGRVLLPKETFTGGAAGTATKQSITNQEENFIRQTELEKAEAKKIGYAAAVWGSLLSIAALAIIINSIRSFIKYGKDLPLPSVSVAGTLWEPPSDIDPAQAEQLLSGNKILTTNSFTATVLSLVQSRVLKFLRSDKKEGFIFKDYVYYLERIAGADTNKLSTIQEYVLSFLEAIGFSHQKVNGVEVEALKLNDIQSWCRAHTYAAQRFFTKFPEVVFKENLAEEYFDSKSHKQNKSYSTIAN